MKCLSGQHPFWWAIMHAQKRIENRRRNVTYRGPILLHASLTEYAGGAAWIFREIGVRPPMFEMLPRGGIIGQAKIVDVIPAGSFPAVAKAIADHRGVDLRWWMPEQFGIVLADVEPLPFVPCKGRLGLWEADYYKLAEEAKRAALPTIPAPPATDDREDAT